VVNADLSPFTDYQFPHYSADTPGEQSAMYATDICLIAGGGVGDLGALSEAGSAAGEAGTAGGEATSLFRAVNPTELEDITANSGAFRNPPGVEVKYFSTSPEGAASYARQTFGTGLYEGPYTVVGTQIPSSMITPEMTVTVDRGISTVVVPTQTLPALEPARIFNFTPLPPHP
jgi:hypothetical protein